MSRTLAIGATVASGLVAGGLAGAGVATHVYGPIVGVGLGALVGLGVGVTIHRLRRSGGRANETGR